MNVIVMPFQPTAMTAAHPAAMSSQCLAFMQEGYTRGR